jgi:hypothetical protein
LPTGRNAATAKNFDASSLAKNGYMLRSYVTMNVMQDVYNDVLVPEPAGLSVLALSALFLRRR